MKGYRDFIVKVDNLTEDKITTEGGLELFLDRRMSKKQVTNTVVEVVSTPCTYNGPVKAGFKLLVDPTIFFTQVYEKGGEMDSINLIDPKKNWYKVNPSMVIAYNEGPGFIWTGFEDNILVKKITETKKEPLKMIGSIIVPEMSKEDLDTKKYKVEISNNNTDVKEGDTVFVNEMMVVDIFFKERKLSWIRNKDLLATVNQ